MRRIIPIAAAAVALAACGSEPKPAYQPTNEQLQTWAGEDRAKAADEAAARAARAEPPTGMSNHAASMDAAPAPGTPQVQLDGSASGAVPPPPAPDPTPAPAADAPPARHPC